MRRYPSRPVGILLLAAAQALISSLSLQARAQSTQPAAPRPKRLFDTTEVNYTETSGNTATRAFWGSQTLLVSLDPYAITLKGSGYLSKFGSVTTLEWYSGDLRLDRKLSNRLYLYGLGTWDKNRFAAIDDRYSSAAGPGLVLLHTFRQTLHLEQGGGYFIEYQTNGNTLRAWQARAALIYELKLTDTSKLAESLEGFHNFSDPSDPRLRSESSLAVAINNRMGLKWSYTYLYRGHPVPGFSKTDRILSTGIYVNL